MVKPPRGQMVLRRWQQQWLWYADDDVCLLKQAAHKSSYGGAETYPTDV